MGRVLGDPSSLNRSVYAGSNPITYVDPSGRCFQAWVLAFAGPPGAAAGAGISLGCAVVGVIAAAAGAAAVGAAAGQATSPLINEIRGDPTHVRWTPPTAYNQPPTPRTPSGGDPEDPDYFARLTGRSAIVAVSTVVGILLSLVLGVNVQDDGRPIVVVPEPEGGGTPRAQVLRHGPLE